MPTFKQSFNSESSSTSCVAFGFQARIETMKKCDDVARDDAAREVGRRLESYIRATGMSYVRFADAVAAIEGPGSKVGPQTVTHWRKTGKIAREKIVPICRVLGITPNELLGMDRDHSQPAPSLGPSNITEARAWTTPPDRNVTLYEPTRPARPVVASVIAGNFRDAIPARTPSDEPWFEYPRLSHSGDHAVWLIVDGDSMDDGTSAAFREGDLILVDPDAPWDSGDFVIIANGGNEWTFKRIRKDGPTWYMEALNPGYHPRVREIPDGWRVVAKVLEVMPKGRKVG